MTTESTFQPGDVVVFKSGGPMMTVHQSGTENTHCIWFHEDGTIIQKTLPTVILKKYEPVLPVA